MGARANFTSITRSLCPIAGAMSLPVPRCLLYARTSARNGFDVMDRAYVAESTARNTLYIALEGSGSIAGEPFQAGEAWEVAAGSPPFEIAGAHAVFLTTSEPA